MLRIWCRTLAVIGLIAVLLHSTATMAAASLYEAGLNYASAKDEMSQMLEAASQEKARVFAEYNDKFKKDMDVVQLQLEQLGKNLHEKERKWLADTTREKAVAKYMKVVAAIGQVKQALSEAKSPSSETSNLKSEWGEFCTAFDKLWEDYQTRGKQLAEAQKEVEERVKLFKEDCGKCL
jgi:signal transduction histidine kinase